MNSHFDYIITGSGCAGLSLLHAMMRHPFFASRQILVIDQANKNKNDRTWCFWETEPGPFDAIVHHRWKQIDFCSDYFSARFDIVPYEYKMIRGIDFYNYVSEQATQKSNISFYYGSVETLHNDLDKGIVTVNGNTFSADYIFNSIIFDKSIIAVPGTYQLLQHFKGWLIETPQAVFDSRIATFMDFRVSQHKGTTFVYVLPLSANKALIEYTLFTENILAQHEYDACLGQYIKEYLGLKAYSITEEEFGVIPMTNYKFPQGEGQIVHIGTAGGQTKASSGFTFRFIQKHTAQIIRALVQQKDPHTATSFAAKRFRVYDSTLLNILHHKKLGGDRIFADLFRKNPPQSVLRFLDNETSLTEELRIMSSVPAGIFFPAAIREMLK